MANFKHSFSTLKAFETCPRQCHEVRILKNYPFVQTEAAAFGDRVHKAIEDNINIEAALPAEFANFKPVVDAVKAFPGRVKAEVKYAVDRKLRPVSYFDREVWFRCKIDVSAVDDDNQRARVVDWKTGKDGYPEPEQLVQNAMLLLKNEPHILSVTGRLVYLMAGSVKNVPRVDVEMTEALWADLRVRAAKLEAALDADNFIPKQNAFCRKHCVVRTCEFNGQHHRS